MEGCSSSSRESLSYHPDQSKKDEGSEGLSEGQCSEDQCSEGQCSEDQGSDGDDNWTETTLLVPQNTAVTELEFGGARGAAMTIVMMPLTVFLVNAACGKAHCSILQWPCLPVDWSAYFDMKAMLIYLGWLTLQVFLHLRLPGHTVLGQPLQSGHRLPYLCNGFSALVTSVLLFVLALYLRLPVTYVYDKLTSLITMATITSFILSVALYLKAQLLPLRELSPHGNTGIAIYDFHLGHELNPRIGNFDLKFFCELRPGLIGWLMLDLVYMVRDWEQDGQVSATLVMVTTFHGLYVADALYFEPTVLTTLDLTTEGFGFMLVFGDLTWVPFIFSLQARFLLEHPQEWSGVMLLLFFMLNCVGYWVFRASNNQKDMFRHNPRHSNVKGFGHCLPWYYMLYLSGALTHRTGRDDKLCQAKYGALWRQYCYRVPYKIIPFVY